MAEKTVDLYSHPAAEVQLSRFGNGGRLRLSLQLHRSGEESFGTQNLPFDPIKARTMIDGVLDCLPHETAKLIIDDLHNRYFGE